MFRKKCENPWYYFGVTEQLTKFPFKSNSSNTTYLAWTVKRLKTRWELWFGRNNNGIRITQFWKNNKPKIVGKHLKAESRPITIIRGIRISVKSSNQWKNHHHMTESSMDMTCDSLLWIDIRTMHFWFIDVMTSLLMRYEASRKPANHQYASDVESKHTILISCHHRYCR